MLKRLSVAILLVVFSAGVSYSAAALKPSTLPGFSNISTVQEGTGLDLNVQPDSITWQVATFGDFTSFEITLDGAIDYPCSTASYYPLSTMSSGETVFARGVPLTGERCVKGNLRTKAGTGGITNIKINIRGLE